MPALYYMTPPPLSPRHPLTPSRLTRPPTAPTIAAVTDRRTNLALLFVLAVAAAVRVPQLGRYGYTLDEAWSMEIATGRGSAHEHVPTGELLPRVPHLFSLADAPPWWAVWSHVEVTHPPLYPVALRWWGDVVGDGDGAGRAFAVVFGLVGVGLLFDVVRVQSGRVAPAAWAALLMAVAGPQLEHARLARSYTMLVAAGLLAVDGVVRMRRDGVTRGRWAALVVGVLGTVGTHYFGVGAMLGLAAWAVVQPTIRRPALTAFATAAVVFAVAWGPFMWRQRHLFATTDPDTAFLVGPEPRHAWTTAVRAAALPVVMLDAPRPAWVPTAAVVGAVAFVLPLVPAVRRRQPWATFWWAWAAGTVGVVVALDLARGTTHLIFTRYTLLAGPAVCALVPLVAGALRPWLMPIASAVAVTYCCLGLPTAYDPYGTDPRAVVARLPLPPGPADLLLFGVTPTTRGEAGVELMRLSRYLPTLDVPCAVLTGPAPAPVAAAAGRARVVYLVTSAPDPHEYLPATTVVRADRYPGFAVFTLAAR